MRYLSICSGIEAATVAWESIGWKPVAFAEIEPFPCAVLAHHYPEIPNLGDITHYDEWDIEPRSVDLLCGGTPCQSFSVAGMRKGLEDPRGNLCLVYVEIAAKFRPTWLVWENVAGVFSSGGGHDFATFLGALTGRAIHAPKDGWRNSGVIVGIDGAYSVAWRVYDAQYFGVAQRRRRVFVVGHLGDWRAAAAVLFEPHSLQGHSAPRRSKKENPSEAYGESPSDGCGSSIVIDRAAFNSGENAQFDTRIEKSETMSTLVARGPHAVGVPETANCLQTTCDDYSRADGFNMIAVHGTQDPDTQEECAHTLGRNTGQENAILDVAGTICRESFTGGPSGRPEGAAAGHFIPDEMRVRRLTPIECERLQGFADDYTAIPWRGKPAEECPDGHRYRSLGNSWAVPCARSIGENIQTWEELYA